jgi:CheY-like chemotaxis protein
MADLGLMEVIVSDTGPGVAPEQRDRIFGAYKQVGNGQARGEGTGLGLALARQIVARLGGDMGVRAAPGGGAAFWFRVPLSASTIPAGTARAMLDATAIRLAVDWPPLAAMLSRQLSARGAVIASGEMAAVLTIEPAPSSDTGPALALNPASPRVRPVMLAEPVDPDQLVASIRDALQDRPHLAVATASDAPSLPGSEAPLALTADDSEINRLVTAALLADAGWRVETAQDGGEAVEAARRLRPALILLDLSMPKLDGLAAARAIRALPLPPGETPPRIFAATGHDDPSTLEAVRRAGMNGLLVKPLTAATLSEALNGQAARLQRAG